MPSNPDTAVPATATPWFRLPIVWLVIGGPALVVVASFVTLALAIGHPDPVVADNQAMRTKPASEWPALQARNHAARPAR